MARRLFRYGCVLLALTGLAGCAATWLWPGPSRDLAGRMLRRVPETIRDVFLPPPDPLAERLAERNLTLGRPAYVRIVKEQAELEVWMKSGERYVLYRSYPICRYSGDLGPKLKEGDRQAPEGFYAVSHKQLHPGSRQHLAFNLAFRMPITGRTGAPVPT